MQKAEAGEKLNVVEAQLDELDARINQLESGRLTDRSSRDGMRKPLMADANTNLVDPEEFNADPTAPREKFSDFVRKRWKPFPFHQSYREQGESWKWVLMKWFVPGFLNACCIFISMWLLHMATYRYVQMMTRMEKSLHNAGVAENKQVSDFLQEFGALDDPVAGWFPRSDISLAMLDKVAAVFPMSFMLGVTVFDDVRLFTKIMFCNGFMALVKGTIDVMTVLPDSGGWENCKDRLTPLGVSFFQDPNHSAWDLFKHEATGVNGQHLRWCSDMLVSGHTYFTTLYALGCYELIRKVMREETFRGQAILKLFAIGFVVVIGCIEQMIEIYAVTVDRFHYSMDIYLAIILTLVVYTNAIPCIVAKHWWGVGGRYEMTPKDRYTLNSEADILLPVCCVPFCCLYGRMHVYDDKHVAHLAEHGTGEVPKNKVEREHLRIRNSMGEGVHFAKVFQNLEKSMASQSSMQA